ncbi:hypothetical protein OPT61_g763 [Boeremia exigua]|uniref:Uncharacterized protein n=1 Tax=Boeremia exigua TaxID=749465 RepID=A0ACC2ISX8_9PLEO|nr:hypothetical protein OPT61_g763 [Boeremia exigua]
MVALHPLGPQDGSPDTITMSDATLELMEKLARHQRLQSAMELVLGKIRSNAGSVTAEDARNLADNAEEGDKLTDDIIGAVADLAVRNEHRKEALDCVPSSTICLSHVVEDLYASVKANPGVVSTGLLQTTQVIVSMMQKAISHTNTPHPELAAELQQEHATIVPKLERGIVTKAEADHSHSLEVQANAHIEKGDINALAQSTAARCERKPSTDSASSNSRPHSGYRTSTPQEPPRQIPDETLSTTEIENERACNDVVATGTSCFEEHSPPEKRPRKNEGALSNSPTRRYHSLSDSTNATRGDSRSSVREHASHAQGGQLPAGCLNSRSTTGETACKTKAHPGQATMLHTRVWLSAIPPTLRGLEMRDMAVAR